MGIDDRIQEVSHNVASKVYGRMEQRRAWNTGYADRMTDTSTLHMGCKAPSNSWGTSNAHIEHHMAYCKEDTVPFHGRSCRNYEHM